MVAAYRAVGISIIFLLIGATYILPRSRVTLGKISTAREAKNTPSQEKIAERILTIESRGRLGNKLFQVAVLIATALRNNMTAHIDWGHRHLRKSFNMPRRHITLRKNWNSFYKLRRHVSSDSLDHRLFNLSAYFPFGNIVLRGYFHSFRYLAGYEDVIRKEFTFTPHVVSEVQRKMTEQKIELNFSDSTTTKVGIHIRRGDLLSPLEIKNDRPVADANYYKHAMKYMKDKYGDVTFVLGDGEEEWAAKELSSSGRLLFIRNGTPEEDMYVLTSCDHVILSTGTYTKWVGWMSRGTVTYYFPPNSTSRKPLHQGGYLQQWIPLY